MKKLYRYNLSGLSIILIHVWNIVSVFYLVPIVCVIRFFLSGIRTEKIRKKLANILIEIE